MARVGVFPDSSPHDRYHACGVGHVETRSLDRLTASDRFLMWDDYGWSSDIGAVAVLDGTTLLDRRGEKYGAGIGPEQWARFGYMPEERGLYPRR